jgi:hypothetical protein
VNRFEQTRQVLLLEAAAAELKARAALVRADLAAAARKEHEEQGSAPTWRFQDVGTWTLPLSQQSVYVSNDAALLAWVADRPGFDPTEAIETTVRLRPWYVAELLRLVQVADGQVIDDEGTIVPGLAIRAGGVPGTLSFRADPLAKVLAGQAAGKLVGELVAGGGPEAPDEAR